MTIPNKFSGYSRDGIRKYPGGGGGGGGGDGGGGTVGIGDGVGGGPAGDGGPPGGGAGIGPGDPGVGGPSGGGGPSGDFANAVNRVPRAPTAPRLSTVWNQPQPGSTPAPQPVYRPSYQNYANPGSAMGVSQYGQRPPAIRMPQPSNPFNNRYQPPQQPTQQPSTQDQRTQFAGLLSSGNYQGGVNYARGLGFSDADIAAHIGASGLKDSAGNVISQDIANSFLAGYPAQPTQQQPNSYTNRYQPPQMQQYQQPQMQQYQQYPQQLGNPFTNNYQPPMQRTSSGPSQAIVSRSAQMRGAPNVMRRAEGGIASLIQRK